VQYLDNQEKNKKMRRGIPCGLTLK
jgi:hypothetical protein